MSLYILDTDHLSLYGCGNLEVLSQMSKLNWDQVATTAISVEEQLHGRLAQVAQVKENLEEAYRWLIATVRLLNDFRILNYDSAAQKIYKHLKQTRLRVGTQDMRIASIALANHGILVTRNRQDFERVPGLKIEDWSA